MPTYEYECLECKYKFDVIQSINDDPIQTCVKCNSKVRKLFGTAGIIFKGSGFYVNDYRKRGKEENRTSNHADAPSEKKTECPAAGSCSTSGCGGNTLD